VAKQQQLRKANLRRSK